MPYDGEIRNNRLSNPAKILAAYMKCSGITDAKQLASDLDIPIRTIQRLKLECATCANDAIYGASKTPVAPDMAAPVAPNAPDMAFSDSAHRARANKELPSEVSSYQEVKIIPLTPKTEVVERVRLTADGTIEFCSDLRKFWLNEFEGNERRLRLALVEVRGRIQANSSRPLEAQVSSQLARIVADKADKDQRYSSAVIANQASKPAAKPFRPSRW